MRRPHSSATAAAAAAATWTIGASDWVIILKAVAMAVAVAMQWGQHEAPSTWNEHGALVVVNKPLGLLLVGIVLALREAASHSRGEKNPEDKEEIKEGGHSFVGLFFFFGEQVRIRMYWDLDLGGEEDRQRRALLIAEGFERVG